MASPIIFKTNLTNLTQGTHTLTLYGDDAAGNMVTSETITFTVDQTGPFPVVIAVAVLTGVAVAGVMFLFFRRRLRSRKSVEVI